MVINKYIVPDIIIWDKSGTASKRPVQNSYVVYYNKPVSASLPRQAVFFLKDYARNYDHQPADHDINSQDFSNE